MSIEELPVTPKGKATRKRLLIAARTVAINSDGTVEIAAVAKEAKVTPSLINRYFGSKAGLISALVRDHFARFGKDVMSVYLDDQGSWAEHELIRIRKGVQFYYNDPFVRVFHTQLVKEPEVLAIEAEQTKAIIDRGARSIRKGQKAGELPLGVDPGLAAAAMLGAITQVLLEAMTRKVRPSQKSVLEVLWRQICASVQIEYKNP